MMKKTLGAALSIALTLGFGFTPAFAAPAAPPPPGDPIYQGESMPLDNDTEIVKVMVLLKAQPDGVGNEAEGLAQVASVVNRYNGKDGIAVRRQFGSLVRGFSASLPANKIATLAADPDVASVEKMAMFYPTMHSAGELTTSVQARSHYGVDGRGLVVSVVDSGIDIAHRDLRIDDDAKSANKLAPQPGWTDKVPYGWNFADDTSLVKDTGSQHGMHVAGIIGANAGKDASVESGRMTGIAPNAQLLAMKVFSNDPVNGGGASEDDIIAAIEKSVEMKADIINLSLGSPGGLHEGGEGEGRAILNASKAGVQVVVAAGNDGLNLSPKGDLVDDSGLIDNGPMSNPGSTPGAWTVASVDNVKTVVTKAEATWNGGSHNFGYQMTVGKTDGQPHTLVDCGIGKPEEIPASARGNYCLVQRGTLNFSDKYKNVVAAGATGIIIYNNAGDAFVGIGGVDSYKITGAVIFQSDGEKLKAQAANGLTITLNSQLTQVPMATPLQPSSFTSWGVGPELEFKPNIAGIGGSVWSTANNDGYQNMSGTSMATPHIAGVTAIGLQEYQKRYPGMSAVERGELLKTALTNTARILDHGGVPYAPRQIGAGLAQTDQALTTSVFATVDGKPQVALKQIKEAKTFTVTLTNKGTKDRTFTAGGTCVLNEIKVAGKPLETACSQESLKASNATITVPAGASTTVSYTLTPNTGSNHFIEGWATLASSDAEQPSLAVPYLGFVGDWNAEKIIEAPRKSVADKDTLLIKLGANATNTTGLYSSNGTMMSTRMFSFAWVSPNGDGIYDDVFPSLALLRSAKEMRFSVLDASGKTIRELGTERNKQRSPMVKLAKGNRNVTASARKWDGTLYDPASDSFKPVPSGGSYTYRVEARLSEDMPWQVQDFPFQVDTVAPTMQMTKAPDTMGGYKYTLLVDDANGSGVLSSGISAVDSQTGRKLSVRMNSLNTFSFIAGADSVGHPITISYTDIAGNGKSVVDICGATGVKFVSTARFAHPINGKSKDASGQLIINNGKIDLSAAVTADVAKVSINGKDVPVVDGQAAYQVDAATSVTEYTAIGYDAQGKEIAKDTVKVTVDLERPTLTITKAPLDDQGRLILDANGEATIEGKVADNRASMSPAPLPDGSPNLDDQLWVLDGSLMPYEGVRPDGTFSITVAPAPAETSVGIYVLDYFDLGTFKYLNLGGARIPLARAATSSVSTPLEIMFDEGRFDGKSDPATGKNTQPFGDSLYILDKTYHGLVVEGDKTYLDMAGHFNRKPGSFKIHGKDVAIDANNHFSVRVQLTGPITNVGYEVHEIDGSLVANGAWRLLYDRELPGYELITSPAIAADGVLYLQKDKAPIDVKGSAWDNGFGYTFAVNGQTLANATVIWDPSAKVNMKKYQTTIDGVGGQFMRVSNTDFVGNGIERTIPIVSDLADPTLVAEGVPSDGKITQNATITVKATDAHLKDLTVLVDGQKVGAKLVSVKQDPAVKMVTTNPTDPTKPTITQTATPAEASLASTSTDAVLTYEVTGLKPGKHMLSATASDLSGRTASLEQPLMVNADLKPVIGGPEQATITPDEDLLAQLRALFPVTDDVDKNLQVSAETSGLMLNKTMPLVLTVKDSAGNVTERTVMITLQRPEQVLKGACGQMKGRFKHGDTITITCSKHKDGRTKVVVKNSSDVVIKGTISLPGLVGPVELVDEASITPVSAVVATVVDGALTFEGSSAATYLVGPTSADVPQPGTDPAPNPGTDPAPTPGTDPAPLPGNVPPKDKAPAPSTQSEIADTGVSSSASAAGLLGLALLGLGAVVIRGKRREA